MPRDGLALALEHARMAAARADAAVTAADADSWRALAMSWIEVANAIAEAEARSDWAVAGQAANSNWITPRP